MYDPLIRRLSAALLACCLVVASGIHAGAQQTPPAPTTPPSGATPAPLPPAGNPVADPLATPELLLEARPALVIRGEATWDDGFDILLKAFRTMTDEAGKAKLAVTGRPHAHFTQTDDFGFKYEAFVLLTQPAPAGSVFAPSVLAGQTPAGKVMRFPHNGAYDDIDTTYEAITAFLEEKGLKAKGTFLEEYLNDPKGSDDATLEMNIFVFLE